MQKQRVDVAAVVCYEGLIRVTTPKLAAFWMMLIILGVATVVLPSPSSSESAYSF